MSDILCVTNRRLCTEPFAERIDKIAACHPAGIILREKDLSPNEYRQLALQISGICQAHRVPLILHSFAETAIELHAEAIHLPMPILRRLSEKEKMQFRVIGASIHSVEEALEAEALGCTYITAGHIFETDCKKGLQGRGILFLRAVCEAVSIPVYAIGGITGDNIASVRSAGAVGACLMSSLMTAPNPSELIRTMEENYEI